MHDHHNDDEFDDNHHDDELDDDHRLDVYVDVHVDDNDDIADIHGTHDHDHVDEQHDESTTVG
jgi:zinc transport system substrate-binding protein